MSALFCDTHTTSQLKFGRYTKQTEAAIAARLVHLNVDKTFGNNLQSLVIVAKFKHFEHGFPLASSATYSYMALHDTYKYVYLAITINININCTRQNEYSFMYVFHVNVS